MFSRKKRFSWPCLLRAWFTFSDWFLHVSFNRFQYFNLHFGSLFHCFIKLSSAIGYSFAKDCCRCLLLFNCKGLLSILVSSYSLVSAICSQRAAVLISRFVYNGSQSLSSAIHLQRTAVLVLWYSFSKDCCPCLCYSFAKDRCPFLVLLIWKGPLSLA